jgi:hypothetical protein
MKTPFEIAWELASAGNHDLELAARRGQESVKDKLEQIIAQETASANATVKRMANLARAALGEMG